MAKLDIFTTAVNLDISRCYGHRGVMTPKLGIFAKDDI